MSISPCLLCFINSFIKFQLFQNWLFCYWCRGETFDSCCVLIVRGWKNKYDREYNTKKNWSKIFQCNQITMAKLPTKLGCTFTGVVILDNLIFFLGWGPFTPAWISNYCLLPKASIENFSIVNFSTFKGAIRSFKIHMMASNRFLTKTTYKWGSLVWVRLQIGICYVDNVRGADPYYWAPIVFADF